MGIILMFMIPLLIGFCIGRALKQWSAIAIIVGIILFVPPTAAIIPALIATQADSVWFHILPMLGLGLSIGGFVEAIKMLPKLFRRTE